MTSVLVFGGAGFIGTPLLQILSARGTQAVCADVRAPRDDAPYEIVDVSSEEDVRAIIERTRPDVVVNLAYRLADASSSDPGAAFAVNVVGAQNVLEQSRACDVERVVFGSSIAVYGDQAMWGDHALTETDERRPVRLYGWQKALNEVLAENYADAYPIDAVALRISTVYGPGRKAGLSAPINDLIEPPPGTLAVESPWPLDEAFDLIHAEDVAAALADLALTDRLEHATYNSGGEYATVGDLVRRLRDRRPEVTVSIADAATSIRHCSRIDCSRLRASFGERPSRLFAD